MGIKLLHPQEVEVFYILPALRREFAKAFKVLKWSQTKIAKVMGVTESAISQYLSDKRASTIELDVTVKESVIKAANKITDQQHFIYEVQLILASMVKSKATCKIHHKVANVGKDCDTCFGG